MSQEEPTVQVMKVSETDSHYMVIGQPHATVRDALAAIGNGHYGVGVFDIFTLNRRGVTVAAEERLVLSEGEAFIRRRKKTSGAKSTNGNKGAKGKSKSDPAPPPAA